MSAAAAESTSEIFENLRHDFPVLERIVRDGKKLVYLDNAATTQKPIQVIDAISDYYKNHNSNIHRAVHALAEESTEAFEITRDKIAKFLNIQNREEIVFVKGTTEAINLVAYAWGRDNIKNDDIVIGVLNGEFTVKKIQKTKTKLFLVAANKDYKKIEISEEMDFSVWGVVTYVVHKTR